jgi:hypothetical protein
MLVWEESKSGNSTGIKSGNICKSMTKGNVTRYARFTDDDDDDDDGEERGRDRLF